MRCDWLIPSFDTVLTREETVPCLLSNNHKGDHLSLVPDGRYIVWAPDANCGCEGEDLAYCECFTWQEISAEEAQKIMAAH